MTELLYYSDGYLSEFDAVVTEITSFRGKQAVVLDRTAFFPEGGGQPGDLGTIEEAAVCDTQIENGNVYHILQNNADFTVGDTVNCAVDFDTRFARMQAHTGEHILSGIVHALYGANNVGFHMDGTVMTVDFDLPLTKEQLAAAEGKANECVYRNVSVTCWYPDGETLKELSYRSKSDVFENIRIVTIEGYDQCACCAVHVRRTGEVGIIKILSSISHRGGVRITLVCGITAYRDYALKHEHTLHIADLLAAKHGETDMAVEKLLQKQKDLSWQLHLKTQAFIAFIKNNAAYSNGNRVFIFPNFTPEELKTAAVELKGVCGGLCVVVSGEDCKGYYFSIASSTVNVKDFTKTVTSALNGSGGGRFDVIQGRFNATISQIESYFSELTVS